MSFLDIFFPAVDLEVARDIARKIETRYPPKVEPKLQFVGGKKRLTGVLETVVLDVENYQRKNRMGIMRKARFVNEMKWQLKEAKYSDGFVDAVCEGIVALLATIK